MVRSKSKSSSQQSAQTSSAARAAFKKLTEPDAPYGIIYVEEGLAVPLESEIARFKDDPSVAVILIPGRNGSLGLGSGALQAAIERAVGSKLDN